ncbi:hypothetical protein B0J14DRAFT_679336, partial [Halenospora varia]
SFFHLLHLDSFYLFVVWLWEIFVSIVFSSTYLGSTVTMPIYPTPTNDYREFGQGTVNNPRIIWLTNPLRRTAGRTEGCEDVAREATDHSTTRTRIRGRRVIRGTDPHITVYYGSQDSVATHQADVFLVYNAARIPRRMARPNEMPTHRGNNPAMSRA